MTPGGTTQRVIRMATENNDRPEARKADDRGSAVQLEFPDLFMEADVRAPNMTGADIISKSDLAMMRGRKKRYDHEKRNEQ